MVGEQELMQTRLPALATSGFAVGQQVWPVSKLGHDDMQVYALAFR